MFSKKIPTKLILFSAILGLSLTAQTSKASAASPSTLSSSELEKLFSSESTAEERSNYIDSLWSSDDPNITRYTVNEFDLCKSSDEANGLSPNEDGSLVKSYIEKIQELSKKEISELKEMGLDDNRINAIKEQAPLINMNRDNSKVSLHTELAARSTGATCSVITYPAGYLYDQTYQGTKYKTVAHISNSWRWDACPMFGYTDAFITTWTAATNLQLAGTTCGAEYHSLPGQSYLYETSYSAEAWNNRTENLNGTSFKFPMAKSDGNRFTEFAKTGYALNTIVSTDFYVGSYTSSIAYAHSHSTLDPSFSIDASGSVDLGFAYEKVSTLYSHSKYVVK